MAPSYSDVLSMLAQSDSFIETDAVNDCPEAAISDTLLLTSAADDRMGGGGGDDEWLYR